MNGRKAKLLRAQVAPVAIQWLSTLMSDEEASKITVDNFESKLPRRSYIYLRSKFRLSAYSTRWFYRKIKKFARKNTTRSITSITFNCIDET